MTEDGETGDGEAGGGLEGVGSDGDLVEHETEQEPAPDEAVGIEEADVGGDGEETEGERDDHRPVDLTDQLGDGPEQGERAGGEGEGFTLRTAEGADEGIDGEAAGEVDELAEGVNAVGGIDDERFGEEVPPRGQGVAGVESPEGFLGRVVEIAAEEEDPVEILAERADAEADSATE